MNGLLALAGLALVVVLLAYALGVRGPILTMVAAALAAGSAGYALQGRPGLGAAPAAAVAAEPPPDISRVRQAFYGNFTQSESWFILSQSFAQRGRTLDAVGTMRAAVRAHPDDAALWVGLGNALVDHAGALTPAGQLAFGRAMELAPDHPAAPFFFGLALARSGDRRGALAQWQQLLANAPADALWRPLVEGAIATLGLPAPPVPLTAPAPPVPRAVPTP